MNLTELRNDLARVLSEETGLVVHAALPGRLTPPCVVLAPGEPYLEAGPTFGRGTVRLEARIVSTAGQNNATSMKSLETMAADLWDTLENIQDTAPDKLSGAFALVLADGAGYPALSIEFQRIITTQKEV